MAASTSPFAAVLAALLVMVLAVPAESAPAETVLALGEVPAKPAGDPGRFRGPETVPGGLLVTSAPGRSTATLEAARAQLGGARVRRLTRRVAGVRVAPGQERAAERVLRALPGVVAVERERTRRVERVPNDPSYPQQWAHRQTRMPGAWDFQTGAETVRVAVIDTGLQGDHPDLAPSIHEAQVNTATGQVTTTGLRVDNDPCQFGHGTAVAGVLGAAGNNGYAVAGVAWQVSLVDIAVSSPATDCVLADSAILAGVDHALRGPAGPVDVLNMSLGAPESSCPTAFQTAIDDARALGVVVVAAAGNHQQAPGLAGAPSVPASCHGVISVGGTNASGGVAGYSVRNSWVDVVAPGGDDGPSSGYVLTLGRAHWIEPTTTEVGTSFSSPYVAGIAALLRAERPDLTPDQVESVLERTALDIAPAGRDDASGWGLVQGDAALQLVAGGQAIGPPEPDPPFPVGGAGGDFEAPPVRPQVYRVSGGEAATRAIAQATAVSDAVFFEGEASHVVIAREDDFADALAGSALGFGLGPLLFTSRTGPLAPETRRELQRVLPRGRTVYLLGGTAALPSTLEGELAALGYQPRRLFGPAREHTAVAVADEVHRLGFMRISAVLLARANDWPDAVTGGSIAAWYGTPVLLTASETLHPSTADALARLRPQVLYALGGSAALSDAVVQAAGEVAGVPPQLRVRLAGTARDGTAVAIAAELEELMDSLEELLPAFAVAVNVRRADGFAHALSASLIPGFFGAVFVPVEGAGGEQLTPAARAYVHGFGIDGIVVGGRDLVTESVREELETLLQQ